MFLDDVARDNGERLKGAEPEKKRRWIGEFDAEGLVVQCAQADVVRILDGAIEVGLGVLQVEQLPHILAGGGRVEHAKPRVNKVVSGDALSGGPLGIRAQVKGVNLSVGRDFVALRQARNGQGRLGVRPHQAFPQRHDDSQFLKPFGCGGVERAGFSTVGNDQIRPLVRTAASGEQAREHQQQKERRDAARGMEDLRCVKRNA